MIGPARLSCRSDVGRAGASRSGAILMSIDEVADLRTTSAGVIIDTNWTRLSSDDTARKGNTTGEGPDNDWVIQ